MSELERWAEIQSDRSVIFDFWEWLLTRLIEDDQSTDMFHCHIEQTLNRYFGVNAKQLEIERRELLDSMIMERREDMG